MRLKLGVGCVVALALAPGSASAASLSGSESALNGLPWLGQPGIAARSIESVTSSYDNAGGIWTTTVALYSAQSAATQAKLYVSLGSVHGQGSANFRLWTNPAAPRTFYFLDVPKQSGSATATTTFSADGRSVTVTVQDPGLVGKSFDALGLIRLSKGNVKFDVLPSLTLSSGGDQGPAPQISLPASDRELRISEGEIALVLGTMTLPASVSAYVEVANQPIATYAKGLVGNPRIFPLSLLPGARRLLPRGAHRAGKLIVMLYSARGRMTVVSERVSVAG